MRHLLIIAALLCQQAFAKPTKLITEHVPVSTSGFIRAEDSQRVMRFSPDRVWQDTVGQILVCPYDANVNSSGRCLRLDTQASAWTLLSNVVPVGYEISGIQFQYRGRPGTELFVFLRSRK